MQTITLGSKTITYDIDGNKKVLPTLVIVTANGHRQYWKIWCEDNRIFRQQQIGEEGKIRDFPVTETEAVNVGKANEMNAENQAIFKMKTMWDKMILKGYELKNKGKEDDENDEKIDIIQSDDQNVPVDVPSSNGIRTSASLIHPMLAQTYTKVGQNAKKYPMAASKKLDGIRGIAQLYGNSNVSITSRNTKQFPFLNRIKDEIRTLLSEYGNMTTILDGEIYSHEIEFHTITSTVNVSLKKKGEHDDIMEYWIFDIVDPDLPYKKRAEILEKLQEISIRKSLTHLKFVLYDIVRNEDEMKRAHDQFVSEGYEGVILRNLEGKYAFKRVADLLKYKEFNDGEFLIVGYSESQTGGEKGAILFMVTDEKGDGSFTVRMRGSIEHRREMAKHGLEYIGKKLSVRYQGIGTDKQPRFPVGIEVREYE